MKKTCYMRKGHQSYRAASSQGQSGQEISARDVSQETALWTGAHVGPEALGPSPESMGDGE